MTYTKERNFIICYDNEVKVGAWNITTGEFYGKTDHVVKKIPTCFTFNALISNPKKDFYSSAIHWFRTLIKIGADHYYDGNRFEQLLSVGLLPDHYSDLNDNTKLTKDVVDYLKKNNDGIYNKTIAKTYLFEKQYSEKIKEMPEYAQKAFISLIRERNMPADYIYNALTRILLEHAEHTCMASDSDWTLRDRIKTMIINYYRYSMAMYHTVEVKRNFLTTLANLGYLYLKYQEEHFDETLKNFNDIPSLYFENDSFVAFPLLTKEAFHEEATQQNNCVERCYMDLVAKGQTHVVAIRKKDNIDESYITCEVTNEGNIYQYLRKNNCSTYETNDLHFKREYQNHLNINFTKGA